jgi:predicted DNA-binding transcriptional regulator AlpA
MPANPTSRLHESASPQRGAASIAAPTVAALLVPAEMAGSMCGRSEASWWRDHAAGRIPAPIRLGGRTLWRVQELRDWVEAGCPDRQIWQALRRQKGGDQ